MVSCKGTFSFLGPYGLLPSHYVQKVFRERERGREWGKMSPVASRDMLYPDWGIFGTTGIDLLYLSA